MQPSTTGLTVFKGAKFHHDIVFKAGGVPVDLTGLGPFVSTFSHPTKDQVLATHTVTSDYDDTGAITVEVSAEQTGRLPLGFVRWGIRDSQNNPYVAAVCPVEFFSPPPA
jgi:hypothetical protein